MCPDIHVKVPCRDSKRGRGLSYEINWMRQLRLFMSHLLYCVFLFLIYHAIQRLCTFHGSKKFGVCYGASLFYPTNIVCHFLPLRRACVKNAEILTLKADVT
jgi:hypothetical protein